MKLQGIVILKDYKGNLIQDKITSFKYVFSEEEDDLCEITIESDDRLLADTPAYQEGQEMTVQWGWAGASGKMSNIRKVYIFDTRPTYAEQVKLILTCHEKFVIAKMDVAANKNETTIKKGTPLILSSNVMEALNIKLQEDNPELEKLLTKNNITVLNKSISSKKYHSDKRIVSYFNGNMSTFQGLRTYLNKLQGGPYIIESRDDTVNIKTRDLAQPSIRKWTYRGGNEELIDFTPEKKTRSKASQSNKIGITNWHPEDKEAINQESSQSDEGQIKLTNSQLIKDWHLFGKNGQPKLEYAPTFGISPKPLTPNQAAGVPASLGGAGFKKLYNQYDFGKQKSIQSTQQNVFNVGVFQFNHARPMFQYVEDTPEPKKNIYSVDHDSEKALALADNQRKDAEAKNEKGNAKVLGEPDIECGMIVSFDGVGTKDSGNYYIFTCEHVIDENGYILNMSELGRQGVNKNVVTPPVKTLDAVNNPFPQFNPYANNRNFDYGYKNKIAPHILGLGATREKIVKENETHINKSVGPIEQQNIKGVIPKIKKPD